MKTTDVLQEDVPNLVRESDSVSLSEADWALAKKRFASLSPLFDLRNVPKKKAREASLQLGIDSRTVYRMINRFRASGGLLSSLIRRASSGGAGKGRLSDEVEAIISDSIKRLYLNRQRHKVETVVTDVKRKCVEANLPVPGGNSVRRRIAQISQREAVQKRQGHLAKYVFRSPSALDLSLAVKDETRKFLRLEWDHLMKEWEYDICNDKKAEEQVFNLLIYRNRNTPEQARQFISDIKCKWSHNALQLTGHTDIKCPRTPYDFETPSYVYKLNSTEVDL